MLAFVLLKGTVVVQDLGQFEEYVTVRQVSLTPG